MAPEQLQLHRGRHLPCQERSMTLRDVTRRECKWCGAPATRFPPNGGPYCSVQCGDWFYTAVHQGRDRCVAVASSCDYCSRPFVARKSGSGDFCSTSCRRKADTAAKGESCRVSWFDCCDCGRSAIAGRSPTQKRCDACAKVRRRARDRRKHAVRRGARVAGELFTKQQVGDRDGWRCHLCGRRVSAADADVDHLVPVSAGGVDELRNVAISHSSCNRRRGAGGLAQLRLIA